MSQIIQAVDLFCGSGGTSTGLMQAARALGITVDLVAVNHWRTAIETHTANHPGVTHFCEDLETVSPRRAVPGGRLDLLVASPSCVHHSNARGGKPMSEQSRATAWHVLRWAEELYIEHILIENVREFRDWGPLDEAGRPIPAMKGRLYRQLLSSLRALGYTVGERILNSADFGEATTRQRLFIQARRGRKAPLWPVPTHLKPGDGLGILDGLPQWRAAREVIDWSLPSRSIYDRKKPLAENTLRRILAGLHKYSGLPFVVGAGGPSGGGEPQSVEQPLGTVLTKNSKALCQPFLVVLRGNCDAQALDRPVPSLCAGGGHFGLCEPFITAMEHSTEGHARRCYPMERPLPTVTGSGDFGLCQPFLVPFFSERSGQQPRGRSLEQPLPTITAQGRMGVCEPYLVEYHGGETGDSRTRSLDAPLCTVDTANRVGLVQPYLVNYHGNGQALSLDEPLDTVDTRDRFALVSPELAAVAALKGEAVAMLDIRFRMLQPHELAAAMGFPADYVFAGNRSEQVKQIGNAVSVRTAQALCRTILEGRT